ncbi:MAG: biotin transporter BioY [Eubacteriales bacterium]
MKKTHNNRLYMLISCALFAALTAVLAQIQVPLYMVPINLALITVYLSGTLLGAKYGSLSMFLYVIIGALGIPVFAGFAGGLGVLFGKTGGYIIGYIIAAFLIGLLSNFWGFTFLRLLYAMIIGTLSCYLVGTLWFMFVTKIDLWASLTYCVFPFVLGDLVKMILAASLTLRLRKPLINKGLLP